MAVAAVAAIAAVVALVVLGGALRDGGSTVQHTAEASGFVLGSADAPVLITAWEDFQCPICKAANASVLKQIEDEYVTAGKVRIQYRQFPFLGPESTYAAEASQCAADQHRFWDYHDALFNGQRAENSGTFSKANLKKVASSLGFDMGSFDTCLDESWHKDSVQAEKKIGQELGVNATPTFFVNGKPVKDWRDYSAFKALIDQALAAAGRT
ncbi:MAG TPA: DsbA family protein [Dehalococcoidia bacterium]|nr:DsbA family protein [Dehalococcoidia bacterium]